MDLWPICAVFFLSGIAGLIYEVVWVRSFGNIFGNTVYSSAIVTSVFMCGLGAGSYLAGRIADRRHPKDPLFPLRAYAVAELGIGALGYGIAVLLPRLERGSAFFSSYARGADGWYELSAFSHVLRYALAVVLLTPSTLLMGATLTLLLRHLLSSNLAHAGRRTGLLYGVNTLGAACGCVLVDFQLIPKLGLHGTQQMAVFCNLLAGLAAWMLFRSSHAPAPSALQDAPVSPSYERAARLAAATLFLTGFAGMGMEIVWFRFLTSALGQFRSVFSLLLAVILSGIWLGSVIAGRLADRFGRPRLLFAIAVAVFVSASLLALATFDVENMYPPEFITDYYAVAPAHRFLYELTVMLKPIVWVAGIPALCIGASFPLANAIVQTEERAIGRTAGSLYVGNTLGAVAGSLAAGFVLLPGLGMKWSVFVCASVSLASLVPLARVAPLAMPPPRTRAAAAGALAAILAGLAAWTFLPSDSLLLRSFRSLGVRQYLKAPYLLKTSEGLIETIHILQVPGLATGKQLFTNGHVMSASAGPAQRYMRALAHLPLLQTDAPESVLVICFGVGNTLHAASLHPSVKRLDIADLSRHVLDQAAMFSDTNGGVLDDPRVHVFVNDGRQHLRMEPEATYDVITLEPPPIAFAGVSALYSVEFYELAKSRLKPGGYVTQWLPIRQLPGDLSKSLVRAFVQAFPNAVLLNGEYGDYILMGRNGGAIELDPAAVERRLAAAPAVRADLEKIAFATPLDLAGAYLANAETLARASRGIAPVTDDNPSIEYIGGLVVNSFAPNELLDTRSLPQWCPSCASIEPLDRYTAILGAALRDDTFRYISLMAPVSLRARPMPMTKAAFDDTVQQSPYLQRLMSQFRFSDADFAERIDRD